MTFEIILIVLAVSATAAFATFVNIIDDDHPFWHNNGWPFRRESGPPEKKSRQPDSIR